MNAARAFERIAQLLARGEPVVEVLVVASSVPGVQAGSRMLVTRDHREGGLGDPLVEERAGQLAIDALPSASAASHDLEFAHGRCDLYLEPHRPRAMLVIVGAGHIARPLSGIGAMLGYRVVVIDDRPEFARPDRFPDAERVVVADMRDPFRQVTVDASSRLVLVTRGHRHDFEALRLALRLPDPPGYIGMVGSQRRVRATLEQLAREGVGPDDLSRIHAPIGLDIGAQTPAEIAVAIAAELVLVRGGGTGEPLRERKRVLERWITPR